MLPSFIVMEEAVVKPPLDGATVLVPEMIGIVIFL
jgi:hypothetical protein